ncbi:hypothetical protein BUPH_08391 (plasmid) [Paraburkholderia phenoliruptrix BR3459a]|uniref:Uncharacterized protein n=1 Tax=Paraburkholderia phenoliruptrix BR3459a TaxID=1229205 RepID=K0E0V0_9BURK|nr:hypothetical protein BUPH_08391 [Paraburkholderia phenoliruptrix BR3459a]
MAAWQTCASPCNSQDRAFIACRNVPMPLARRRAKPPDAKVVVAADPRNNCAALPARRVCAMEDCFFVSSVRVLCTDFRFTDRPFFPQSPEYQFPDREVEGAGYTHDTQTTQCEIACERHPRAT